MALTVTPTDEMKTLKVGEKIYEIVDDEARTDLNTVKADLGYVTDAHMNIKSEKWCAGTEVESWTSSTFSGFATSWDITEDKYVKSLKFKVRSRAETNITEIRVRIESGSFSTEKSMSVNIGSTSTEIEFPINAVVPYGTVWIGIACNKVCTFVHVNDDVIYAYKYWTNGDLSHLSQLKDTASASHKLYLVADCYSNLIIEDKAITIPKTDFLTLVKSNNLIDRSTVINGYWYDRATGQPTKVELSTNQYTAAYQAVPIPVEGLEKITVASNGANTSYYAWFATTECPTEASSPVDFIQQSGDGLVSLSTPQTITVPDGAKYILMSTYKLTDADWIMANEGNSALPYEEYYEDYYINGNKILLDTEEVNTPSLKTPASYDLVVGDTFQLFYKGIVSAVHFEQLEVAAGCSKGAAFERFFEITPASAETLSLALSLFDNAHNIIDEKTISLKVHAKASSPDSQKNVLCVGDSLTEGGVWVKELHRRLTASNGNPVGDALTNINFIGTKDNSGVHYEGYGGWTFNSYNTENVSSNAKTITCTHDKDASDQHSIYQASNGSKWKLETIENGSIKILLVSGNAGTFSSTGTLTWVSGGTHHSDITYSASANAAGNPFWNSDTSKVDFANYASEQGVSSIDYVYVLLGWNSASASEAAYKEDAQTFIDNVQADFPNAKIVLIGLEVPARDGLAVNYGASGIYSEYWTLMQYVFRLDEWYEDLVDSNSNVYHMNLSGQFDTEHNMPTSTRQVNTRNSDTETYQSNGVHPATSGYYQIADAVYRDITARL